ncbi:MAG: efflux RND transporter periplasmic adaptor subunit [Pseudomonadota bacterium]|nr:efflux RND transporter periplasmic adaptor subunit [Pseudomonadota bacterium]
MNRSVLCLAALAGWLCVQPASATEAATPAAGPQWVTVGGGGNMQRSGFDGVVEAERQTNLSVQVSGAIVEIGVKAGDQVKAGQVLMRIDARAAVQGSAASDAQVQVAQAGLDVARKDWQRQQQLFAKGYVSQAALDRDEARLKSAEAQLAAQQASAAASHTQTGWFVLRAPYAGVIAEVPVASGDIAMPGKPLAVLYDPAALRVSVAVPQSALPGLRAPAGITLAIPGIAGGESLAPTSSRVMPMVDAASHTVELRLALPALRKGIRPGMFARAWLPGSSQAAAERVFVPTAALVLRGELAAVYGRDRNGQAVLRQVRTGAVDGERTEILAGVGAGDSILANPRAVGLNRDGAR